MGFWSSLGLAFKAGGGERPPLARSFVGPWSLYPQGVSPTGEAPFSYAEEVRQAYLGNAIAQRAVRIVAEGVAGAPLTIVTASQAQAERIGALVQASSAGQGLIETLAAHLLLHGNAYAQIIGDADGAPAELFALRPDRVSIEPDAQGWPAAYLYKVGDNTMRLAARDHDGAPTLVHVKAFHPTDDHYGLGCLGAAAKAVAAHNAAHRWNSALLANAARPSGALVYQPGDPGAALTAEQFDRLKAEMDASFAGAANAGRPMLLEGGLSWQAMSLSPADMDFIALKEAAAREIALAFGVPPMLLGLPGDNSYANYREANRALWRLSLLPLADKILAALAEGLSHWWPGTTIAVDRDRLPALSEDRERLWAQVSAAGFLTDDEKRAMLGLETKDAQ